MEGSRSEERVTPLELFFDLVFVFAITQVTSMLSDDPTWGGVGRALLVLGALWWAWTGYAWLTNTVNPDEEAVRLSILGAMAAMLVAALAVPGAFTSDGVIARQRPASLGGGHDRARADRRGGLHRRRRSSCPLDGCADTR